MENFLTTVPCFVGSAMSGKWAFSPHLCFEKPTAANSNHKLPYHATQFFPDLVVFILVPFTILAYMIAGYYVILAPGHLYNALVSEDWSKFRSSLINFAVWATAVLVLKVIRGVLRESTSNYLRERLTNATHNMYFGTEEKENGYGAAPYYKIVTENKIDNPDQRIVSDSRDFARSLLGIVAGGSSAGGSSAGDNSGGLLESLASLVFYSFKNLQRTGWYGILVAYVWSLAAAITTVLAINYTSPVMFKQEQLEADFRYSHTDLRRHAEEVAFLRGGAYEKRKATRNLKKVIENTWVVIARHVLLNFVQYGFSYYMSLIMYLTMAMVVHTSAFEGGTSFSSSMTPGEKAQWISQTGGVFIQLLYSFTMTIQLGTLVSVFVTNTNRMSAMLSELERNHEEVHSRNRPSDADPLLAEEDSNRHDSALKCEISQGISADNVRLQTGSTELGPFSFAVEPGDWVLLSGPSGSGKTSALRALRGLWLPSSGTIRAPMKENAVMFLPQRPYLSSGECTLRQLVLYPQECTHSEAETSRVLEALHAVGWNRGDSPSVIDISDDWSLRLSPGEAQMVAIARILKRRPAYAVMDEPSSSLDTDTESVALLALKRSGVSALTVGHRETLPAFHDRVISFQLRNKTSQE